MPIGKEAIAVGEQVLGPGTLTVADLTNDLAVVLAAVGRHAEAEHAFRESFDRHVVLFGDSHWRIRNVARNLGLVLSLQRRYREALPWMDRAVSSRAVPDTDEIGLEGIRAQRAWIIFVVGRPAEALNAASRAVSAVEGMRTPPMGTSLPIHALCSPGFCPKPGGRTRLSRRRAPRWPGSNAGAAGTRSSPMPNARSDARRCFRAGPRKAARHSSTVCRYIALGVTPTPTPSSPSTGCSPPFSLFLLSLVH